MVEVAHTIRTTVMTLSSCGGDAIHPALWIRGTGLRDYIDLAPAELYQCNTKTEEVQNMVFQFGLYIKCVL
jgi:hypothetical protein